MINLVRFHYCLYYFYKNDNLNVFDLIMSICLFNSTALDNKSSKDISFVLLMQNLLTNFQKKEFRQNYLVLFYDILLLNQKYYFRIFFLYFILI